MDIVPQLAFKKLWKARIEDTGSDVVMLAQPVIVMKLFALGADALLTIFDRNGQVLPQAD